MICVRIAILVLADGGNDLHADRHHAGHVPVDLGLGADAAGHEGRHRLRIFIDFLRHRLGPAIGHGFSSVQVAGRDECQQPAYDVC